MFPKHMSTSSPSLERSGGIQPLFDAIERSSPDVVNEVALSVIGLVTNESRMTPLQRACHLGSSASVLIALFRRYPNELNCSLNEMALFQQEESDSPNRDVETHSLTPIEFALKMSSSNLSTLLSIPHPIAPHIVKDDPEGTLKAIEEHPEWIHVGGWSYSTPLVLVVEKIQSDSLEKWRGVVEALLKRGASPYVKNRRGKNALDLAKGCPPLEEMLKVDPESSFLRFFEGVFQQNDEKTRESIQEGFNPNCFYDDFQLTPLMAAALEGNLEAAALLVEELHADVDLPRSDGLQAIHFAAISGNLSLVIYLLKRRSCMTHFLYGTSVAKLIDARASGSNTTHGKASTALLHQAAKEKDLARFIALFTLYPEINSTYKEETIADRMDDNCFQRVVTALGGLKSVSMRSPARHRSSLSPQLKEWHGSLEKEGPKILEDLGKMAYPDREKLINTLYNGQSLLHRAARFNPSLFEKLVGLGGDPLLLSAQGAAPIDLCRDDKTKIMIAGCIQQYEIQLRLLREEESVTRPWNDFNSVTVSHYWRECKAVRDLAKECHTAELFEGKEFEEELAEALVQSKRTDLDPKQMGDLAYIALFFKDAALLRSLLALKKEISIEGETPLTYLLRSLIFVTSSIRRTLLPKLWKRAQTPSKKSLSEIFHDFPCTILVEEEEIHAIARAEVETRLLKMKIEWIITDFPELISIPNERGDTPLSLAFRAKSDTFEKMLQERASLRRGVAELVDTALLEGELPPDWQEKMGGDEELSPSIYRLVYEGASVTDPLLRALFERAPHVGPVSDAFLELFKHKRFERIRELKDLRVPLLVDKNEVRRGPHYEKAIQLIDEGGDRKDTLHECVAAILEGREWREPVDRKLVNQIEHRLGLSPLMAAVMKRNLPAIRELLALGARADLQGGGGITPLHLAALFESSEIYFRLVLAAEKEDPETLYGLKPSYLLANRFTQKDPERVIRCSKIPASSDELLFYVVACRLEVDPPTGNALMETVASYLFPNLKPKKGKK